MKIPSQNNGGQWTQINDGRIKGVLHDTHNIHFDQNGEATLSRKALALMDSSVDADFGLVLGILYFNGAYNIVTSDSLFRGSLSGNEFSEVASTPQLSAGTDAIVFNSKLYVTTATSLSSLSDVSVWANSLDTYTSGYPHPMTEFASMTTYKLAVGNKNQVETLDTSHNANSTVLTIPSTHVITCLAYRSGYLYIGTKEVNGGEAMIFIWNGTGTNAQYSVPTGAGWVYSMIPYKNSVAFVTNEGELLKVNGTAAEQLAAFPVFYAQGARWEQGDTFLGKVYPRGMAAIGDNIYINVSGDVATGNVSSMKSGVWCYDPSVGLYHYATPNTDQWIKDTAFSISSDTITTSATHSLVLGDAVEFSSVSGVTGVTSGQTYYAIPVAGTTLKIAGSREDADNGNYIAISGTPTSDTFHYSTNIDNGSVGVATSGAIAVTNHLDFAKDLFQSDIIWGASVRDTSDANRSVLCALSPKWNTGALTTQRIYTDNLTQVWKSVYTFVSGLLRSNESAIVKYLAKERKEQPPVETTWQAANVLVTTDPTIRNILEVGDEVCILRGAGQGRYAHITALDFSTVTSQITIDENYGTVAGTGLVRFTGFKKLRTITSSRQREDLLRSSLDTKNSWVQLKVELRGFEPSVTMFDLTNSVDKSAV